MSFNEKSVWGSMFAVLAVYGVYFYHVTSTLLTGRPLAKAEFIVFNIAVVVALVVIEIVYHIVIALTSLRQEGHALGATDERDVAIGRRAAVPSSIILAVGTMAAIGHICLIGVIEGPWFTPIATANLLLLSLVTAQIVEYATQVAIYRRQS